ncbi:calcium-dependent protein kinase 26 [Amborella trichopoda]|uniref:non-specific serine/threonine protein kinase n=1 Tax=Amborella trichopoda TaxID=13333 RepID=U5DAY0_AMBTC|nr:calcium-dependent protein kinase 26 [Amborella trichopoda]ERN19395.1 hypothetical protein AMTR_s00069p00149760 [Amborella trichopoda]|eukprot:XP_006857928.1 calcium-dependent protein kinase 26 [Amborella trichopoda]
MAIIKSTSGPSIPFCNYYKIPFLIEPILDAKKTSKLEDRYVLGEQLGWGQFGVIKICKEKLTGETLACKSIAKDRLVTPDDLCSVKLEIEIMTKLSGHPNVVALKAVFEEEDYVHLVMELCAGGELFHRLEKHGHYSEPEAAILFKHLMEVVMYCHDKGIVHRDLKPENILLATRSLSSPIKLADFGLATYIRPGQYLYGTVGSPFYIAPEVLAGGYNQAADVWSAGVILYILLSGMPPFWGKTKSRIFEAVRAADLRFPSDHWDRVSESAKDLIIGMLCTDPCKRLTAAQVLDHPWIKSELQILERYEPNNPKDAECDLDSEHSSTPMSANRDLSFNSGAGLSGEVTLDCSPAFTCKSSFSSYLATPAPCTGYGDFSFSRCSVPKVFESSSPVPSMPSFSFLREGSLSEQEKQLSLQEESTNGSTTQGEAGFEKLLLSLESSGIDFRRGGAGPSKIQNRRNRTIGLGEVEPLGLMVTESVIRWSSCTHLSSNTSLQSSLVC